MAAPVSELLFQRTAINLTDAARLGEGEDLNDSLLDFFVKLAQYLVPKQGREAPVAFLGSHFFARLTSAQAKSGEEGWNQVSGWAKRKAGGLFKEQYAALAITVNEDLKDPDGKPAGNHWWLAMVLHPTGAVRTEPTAVMCLDSMQRREILMEPSKIVYQAGTQSMYSLEVKKVEQAGFLVIVNFTAKGNGCHGPIMRPEGSRLHYGDGLESIEPELGLRINMPGGPDLPGCFEGTLTFQTDGRVRCSAFEFFYGDDSFSGIKFEFDPFNLTPLQKVVSRYISGYLCKEWETNGPDKKAKFQKPALKALVPDVCQQENLNDCGVFALENILRCLAMDQSFLRKLAEASPAVLKKYPWPVQKDITIRKQKLRAITARLFAAASEASTNDVEKVLKGNEGLREEVRAALTDVHLHSDSLEQWSGQLQVELAARTAEKQKEEEEYRAKEALVQARRDEARAKREEEARLAEEARLEAKRGGNKYRKTRNSESSIDSEEVYREDNLEVQKFVKKKRKTRRGKSSGSSSPPAKKKRSETNGKDRKSKDNGKKDDGKKESRKMDNGKKKSGRKDNEKKKSKEDLEADEKERLRREKLQRKAERQAIREQRQKRRQEREQQKKKKNDREYSDYSYSRSRSRRSRRKRTPSL